MSEANQAFIEGSFDIALHSTAQSNLRIYQDESYTSSFIRDGIDRLIDQATSQHEEVYSGELDNRHKLDDEDEQ